MVRFFDPTAELNTLRPEFEGMLKLLRHSLPMTPRVAPKFPAVNVSEDDNMVLVEAVAPGLDPQSLRVSVLRDQLTLSGDKQGLPAELKGEQVHRNERTSGRFVRTLTLPAEADADKVSAEYTNGILRVTLPKAPTARPRHIQVTLE